MQPGFCQYLIEMSWPLNSCDGSTAPLSLSALRPRLCDGPTQQYGQGGAALPLHTLFYVNIFPSRKQHLLHKASQSRYFFIFLL